MELRRFFVQPSEINGDIITLSGDEFLHMKKVLRYKVGYKAIAFANDGCEYYCTIQEINNDFAILSVDKIKKVDSKNINLTLYAGLLKNNKLDITLQKAVELGVDKFIPFTSQNTNETKFNKARAERIALESAKQCGSVYLTQVEDVVDFESMVSSFDIYDTILFAYEEEKHNSIKKANINGRNIAIIVGSEGGFKKQESEIARQNGAEIITLGKRILRAETAGIVVSALTLDHLGELDNE